LLIAASPWLFGFADGTAAQWMPVILGVGILGMNMVTDYEPALARIVPVPVHLGIDAAGGLLLAVSPWLFGFSDRIYLPHVALGLAEVVLALVTLPRPDTVPTAA
jgi:hypothetical protein